MPKFNVTQVASKLNIKIDDVGDKQAKLMGALQECAEGRCTCPTPQYEKLQQIDIQPTATGVDVTLTPKPGESIDREAIDKCLEYTARQLERDQ
jgi:hypothetical protein